MYFLIICYVLQIHIRALVLAIFRLLTPYIIAHVTYTSQYASKRDNKCSSSGHTGM